MSPEVAKECPYNKSVDVYSFGILLWELLAAEKPFFGYSANKHMNEVVIGGERPRMDKEHTHFWPANLQWLMKRCWGSFPSVRPDFSLIKRVLQDVLNQKELLPDTVAEVEDDGLEDTMSSSSPPSSGRSLQIDPPAPGALKNLFRPLVRGGSAGTKNDTSDPNHRRRAVTTGGVPDSRCDDGVNLRNDKLPSPIVNPLNSHRRSWFGSNR
jgi:serine/threonine protein kinase